MEKEFSSWVLGIGNGTVADKEQADMVQIPSSALLPTNSLAHLISYIYENLHHIQNYASFFQERGILAPRNKEVAKINEYALGRMHGQQRDYITADSLCESEDNTALHTVEFLNSLELGGGFPPHILHLKENAPIMLLQNLDPRRGLHNGTRLICKQFHRKVIEAEIIAGSNVGDRVFIPRIDFIIGSSDRLPFHMRRRQFPIRLAFGMTIYKGQGRTLGILGLYLESPVFSHGQLYVVLSRIKSMTAVKVVVNAEDSHTGGAKTSNKVLKETEMDPARSVSYIVCQVIDFIQGSDTSGEEVMGLILKEPSKVDPPVIPGVEESKLAKMLAKDLTEEEKRAYLTMLKDFTRPFIKIYDQITGVIVVQHHVNLKEGSKPIVQCL
ncbi:hypothetical protein L7F22_037146 [Adiantum nelumboides]|nr:hypothetical protein [Adiantum nelumboides]